MDQKNMEKYSSDFFSILIGLWGFGTFRPLAVKGQTSKKDKFLLQTHVNKN